MFPFFFLGANVNRSRFLMLLLFFLLFVSRFLILIDYWSIRKLLASHCSLNLMLRFPSLTILGSRQHRRSPTPITKSITSPARSPRLPHTFGGAVGHSQSKAISLVPGSCWNVQKQVNTHPVMRERGKFRGPHLTCSDTQLCPILYDPMDCSPPDSSVHGIFQARILEWVAISFFQTHF